MYFRVKKYFSINIVDARVNKFSAENHGKNASSQNICGPSCQYRIPWNNPVTTEKVKKKINKL